MRPFALLLALVSVSACEDYAMKQAARLIERELAGGPPDTGVAPAPPPQAGLPKDPALPMNLAKPDEARVRVELYETREVVRMYEMEHGKPPPSLDGLDLHLKFRADLTYDPRTGTVKSRSYPQY